MRFLYLDNNVLRIYCLKTWDEFEELVAPIVQAGVLERKFNFQSSPYLILEAIGIRPNLQDLKIPPRFRSRLEHFQKMDDRKKFTAEVESTLMHMFLTYKNAFYGSSQLRPKDIHRYYTRASTTFVVPTGKKLFDAVVTDNLIGKFKTYCTHLYSWYAFERTLSQNYPKAFERDFYAYQIAMSKSFFKNNYPNSFSKAFYNIAKDLFELTRRNDRKVILKRIEICRNARKDGRSRKYIQKKTVKLRSAIRRVHVRRKSMAYVLEKSHFGGSRDTVDSEMIHYLIFGSNGLNEPLVAISSDEIDVVACRLSIYKSVINVITEKEPLQNASEGCFYQYDKIDRKLSRMFEVHKVAPFFTYMNQGQDFESYIKSTIIRI